MKNRVAVFVAAMALATVPARAQGDEFAKIEIKPAKVAGSVWMLEGAGGNRVFGKEATIVAQSNVGKRLEVKQVLSSRTVEASPKEAPPVVTFEDRATIWFNGEEIEILHVMLLATTQLVRAEIAKGMTLVQAKKAGFPDEWKPWASDFVTVERWVETIYTSFKR